MKHLNEKGLIIIIFVYVCFTIAYTVSDIQFYTNIINPLFWFSICLYMMNSKSMIKTHINRKYVIFMVIISALYIISYFYLGILFGFSKSPYNHEFIGTLENILTKILPIIGIELTRYCIMHRNRNQKKLLTLVIIIFTLLEINYRDLIYASKKLIYICISQTIIPLIFQNVLYSYLTLKGSYILPLIFRISISLELIMLPIIPNIDWFISGTFNVICVVIIYFLFRIKFDIHNSMNLKKESTKYKLSYIATITVCILIVCFVVGFFKYEPISILSNSMSPVLEKGDLVIYKKLEKDELNNIPINTIIVYNIEEQNIVHRIVNKIKKNQVIMYQTKGDRNNVPDNKLVQTDQIKGIYGFNIKYIGYPSILLYEYFSN